MRCWGTTRQGQACPKDANAWCIVGNVRYALCERHSAANRGTRQHPMGTGARTRSSAR